MPMSDKSMSISVGPLAGHKHDLEEAYRKTLKNVDGDRTRFNVCLTDRKLRDVYSDLFGEAVKQYNAAQAEKGHAERQISDYLDKIKAGKQEKPAYELVIQVGNKDTMPATDKECRKLAGDILEDFVGRWRERYPSLEIATAVIHNDEATPHLHVVYVPVSHGNKRGLETKNSLRGALRECGFTKLKDLNEDMFKELEASAAAHGVHRLDMGMAGVKHLSVRDFKAHVNDPDYPYKNDPALLQLLDETTAELETAQESLGEIMEAVDSIAATPVGVSHLREMREAIGRAGQVRGRFDWLQRTLEDSIEAVEEFFDAVPQFWREHVINPVSAALGGILDALTAQEAAEGTSLDELYEVYGDGACETPSPTRGDVLRASIVESEEK